MPVPVSGAVSTGGFTTVVTAGFTRPADTTQYTANDVVSSSTSQTVQLILKNCVRLPGGTGLIYSAFMFDSVDAATNAVFDLVLFDTTKLTLAADNAAGTITDSELTNCVAVITFDGSIAANVSTVGPNLIIGAAGIGQAFKCAEGARDLYGVVIDRGGYSPASAERFDFKITIVQD